MLTARFLQVNALKVLKSTSALFFIKICAFKSRTGLREKYLIETDELFDLI